MHEDMKLLCGDDDDRLWDISRAVQNSIPGENGNFLHWKFSKGANKISNSISCGGGGRNGPEAARSKSYSYTFTICMCSDHRPDTN
jgi:hypothetical protein